MAYGKKIERPISDESYDRYWWRCVLFAKSYTCDQSQAESMAAEALSIFWQRKASGEEIDMPLPFLFSVIRNKALHFLRHESIKLRAHEEISDDAARELQFRIDTLEACDPHSLYADDVQMILRRTLDSLGEKTDKVFILSRFEGMSNKDISSELGITEKAVEYHITKALKALRIALKDYLPLISIFLGLPPEFFNLKVLLQPFEEQLYLPPVVVQFGHLQRVYIQGVCEEDESPAGLRIQVQYPSDLLGIFAHRQLAVHISDGIGHDTCRQPALPSHGLEVVVLLAPDHEVCSHAVNGE